jgi:uncharacterized membrane protein YbaN (DUF454 family)
MVKRILLLSVGWVCVGLGVLGAFLPVLPTTPFLLVALWCFSHSSERFHHWLLHHRLFGPPLRAWAHHGVIPLGAKVAALTAMAASGGYVASFTDTPTLGWASMAVVCGLTAVFIVTRPSRPRR